MASGKDETERPDNWHRTSAESDSEQESARGESADDADDVVASVPAEVLPQELSRKDFQRILAIAYRGPLPPADEFRKYNEVLPGAAERMMVASEQERAHRQAIERKVTAFDAWSTILSIVCGLVVALAGFGATAYMASLGESWPAVALGGGTLAAIVAVFLRGASGSDDNTSRG